MFLAGQKLRALDMVDLGEIVESIADPPTTWVPVITQVGTVAHTATFTAWKQDPDGWVTAQARLDITGSGTAGTAFQITLPVAAAVTGVTVGQGVVNDTGSTRYLCACRITTSTAINLQYDQATVSAGADPNFGLANGDWIEFSIRYLAAP